MMIGNIHRHFCKYVLSGSFPIKESVSSFRFMISRFSIGSQGGRRGDVELLERSGNSEMETTESPQMEIKHSQRKLKVHVEVWSSADK